jgi:hypothetical protein
VPRVADVTPPAPGRVRYWCDDSQRVRRAVVVTTGTALPVPEKANTPPIEKVSPTEPRAEWARASHPAALTERKKWEHPRVLSLTNRSHP